MAYYTYARGPEHTDANVSTGLPASGTQLQVWTASSGGTRITALRNLAGTALPNPYVVVDSFGRYEFRIESQANPAVWMKDPSAKFWQVLAAEILPQVPTAITNAATAAATATAAVTSVLGGDPAGLVPAVASKVAKGSLVFNVLDYGAVGNGSTDDSTAIAAAYTAARAVKGTVFFPPNQTYINGATINPLGTVTQGYGATLKHKPTMTAVNMFQSAGAASIFGLTIDLNKANTTDPANNAAGCGIYMGAASWAGAVIRDVTVNNAFSPGVFIASTSTGITDGANAPTTGTLIDNLRVDACKFGIFTWFTGGVSIKGGMITGSASDGVWSYVTDRLHIDGLTSNGSAAWHGITISYANNAKVVNCIANGNFLSGIAVGGGSASLTQAKYFTVANNTCRSNSSHGITVDLTISGSGAALVDSHGVVNGNICTNNGAHGINLTNAKYTVVTGNVCLSNTGAGLSVAAGYCTIDGNTAIGNTTYGVVFWGNGSFPNYGHNKTGQANVANGNTTANFYVESTSVANNPLPLVGTGTPASVVAAPVGSTFARSDGGAGTCLYVKESGGVGNTGWVAK